MEIITGYRGEPHITSAQDQGIYRSIFGIQSCILDDNGYTIPGHSTMPASKVNNTTVRVGGGMISFQGCIAACAGETLTFETGSAYTYRCDLIVARYAKDGGTGIESMTLEVIKGTESTSENPPMPRYANYDITEVPSLYPYAETPLFIVYFEGTSISKVERYAPVATNLLKLKDDESDLDALKTIHTDIETTGGVGGVNYFNPFSLPSSTDYSTLGTLEVDPGRYLFVACAFFAGGYGTAGTRVLGIADSAPSGGTISRDRAVTLPSSNSGVYGQVVWPYTCTTKKTIYVIARQDSGYSITVSASLGHLYIPMYYFY